MKTVIGRKKLIGILIKNRNEHLEIYTAAKTEYLRKVRAGLSEVAKKFEETEELDLTPIHLIQPQNFIAQYDEALRMLEFTEEESVSLDENDFKQLVLDKWSWARNFFASNSAYVSGQQATTLSSKYQ